MDWLWYGLAGAGITLAIVAVGLALVASDFVRGIFSDLKRWGGE